jgi:hypothetical protein
MDQTILERAIKADKELKKISDFFAESSRGRKVSIVQKAKQVFLKVETIGYGSNAEIEVFGKQREQALNILRNREMELKNYIGEL